MKAAVLEKPGKLALRRVEMPTCPPGGLLLKTKACAICSTDIKMIQRGQKDLEYPRILGHEVAGIVAESRADNPELVEGTRVQVFPGIVCGRCASCKRGAENQCQNIQIVGFNRDGGFAEYVSIPENSVKNGGINPIPENTRFEDAALAEPLSCCINAQELTNVGEGDSVLIFGAGPAGCLHAMLARARGAPEVIMIDPLDARLSLAKRAKPDATINPVEENFQEEVTDLTDGSGVDVILLASRDVEIDDNLLSLLAPRGRICLFSGLPEERIYPRLNFNAVHYRENMITGAYGCTSAQNRKALDMISSGFDVNWLITKRVGLDEIKKGIEHAKAREGLKVAITQF